MKTILVVGANGQVGKEVMRLAPDFKNLNVIGYGRDELDVTTTDIAKKIVEHEPDMVVNCSAYNDVVGAEEDITKANKVNGNGPNHLAHNCRILDIPLLHISTDYVFDGMKGEPYNEEDKPNPLNNYAKSKLMGEEEVRRLYDKHYIIRTSWVYSQYEGNFVHVMLKKMLNGDDIKVVNDQYGSPTSATCLAEIILKICDREEPLEYGTYHYSSYCTITWYEFAKLIKSMAIYFHDIDCKVEPIKTRDLKTSVKRPYYSVLDCSKLMEHFHNFKYWDWTKNLFEVLTLKYGDYKRDPELGHLLQDDSANSLIKLHRKIKNVENKVNDRG
jgi:dTDP-4-dehydrorhamnose reductase